tara:strand:+ start:112 stop:309 length:198 start_codon:yes stop_codon:yes gene_type:complete
MVLNRNEYQALCNVIDYMHDSELKHYQEELGADEIHNTNNAKNHIWHSVKTLSLMLKEYKMKEIK